MPIDAVRALTQPRALVATLTILLVRDRLKMCRVDAGGVTAEMIERRVTRQRAHHPAIDNDMRALHRTFHPHAPVTTRARSTPLPAAVDYVELAAKAGCVPFGECQGAAAMGIRTPNGLISSSIL